MKHLVRQAVLYDRGNGSPTTVGEVRGRGRPTWHGNPGSSQFRIQKPFVPNRLSCTPITAGALLLTEATRNESSKTVREHIADEC